MKYEQFNAGTYKQYYYGKDYQYKSFSPSFINKPFAWQDKQINMHLEEAVKLLSELNTYSRLIPDVNFFIWMHVAKEAVTSSHIEGTKTGMDEVILQEKDIQPERKDDWIEVQNYIKAMNYSVAELKKLSLCMRLIKESHGILLSGVRGGKKYPGEIRKSQNWIGGSSLSDAVFVPPHQEELPGLLSDLEKFWHNDALKVPLLIKTALSHYQFETIHPFLDGNGRIGRLLIVLQLIDYKFLNTPSLYISDFFDKHRDSYYNALSNVRAANDIEHWIKFFLSGIIWTSQRGIITLKKINILREKYDNIIKSFGRQAELGYKLISYMYNNSKIVVNIKQVSKDLNIAFNTASGIINKFIEAGILREKTGRSRDRMFVLWEYLELLSN
ncbi:MAG: Fic family protein [Armatimonadota bacterium]